MTRTPPAATYDDDFFTWTQDQAAALRGASATLGHGVDIEHVAEEIADSGKRELREVSSFLELIFEHLMKIDAHPQSVDVLHWRTETRAFRRSATRTFSPGMRQSLDLQRLWREGRATASEYLADRGMRASYPEDRPFLLDDILSDAFDFDAALARLAVATAEAPPAQP